MNDGPLFEVPSWVKDGAAPPPARARRQVRLPDAIVRLARGMRAGTLTDEIVETIAIAFERQNDAVGAATVRQLKSPPLPSGGKPPARPAGASLRWFEPTDVPEEPVLSGATMRAVDALARELDHIDRFLEAGIDAPTRILFTGATGTGKTLTARWLGAQLGLPLAVVEVDKAIGSHLGDVSRKLDENLTAIAAAPCILFLDEIEAVCAKRSGDEQAVSRELERATTALLQRLDWMPPAQIVIAATNFPEALDSALRRRLATEIAFEPPDGEARAAMVARWLARVPAVGAQAREELVAATAGLGGADLRARAMKLARAALMNDGVSMQHQEERGAAE